MKKKELVKFLKKRNVRLHEDYETAVDLNCSGDAERVKAKLLELDYVIGVIEGALD